MLTVYLDQMKWIDLARAESGHALGAAIVDPLRVLKRAVADGRVRFPLSAAHYFETGKQRNPRRRKELAATMASLAGTLRIAPPHVRLRPAWWCTNPGDRVAAGVATVTA
jgi:hypothetical protein